MTTISLTKYYKKAVIFPSIVIIISYISFSIIYGIFGKEYKSEWLTQGDVFFLSVMMVALNAMFICILTLPMFFNNRIKIRASIVLSLLTWFLCPAIWIMYILIKHFHYLTNFSHHLDEESLFVFSNTLPYIIGLVLTYFKFRRDLNTEQTVKDE